MNQRQRILIVDDERVMTDFLADLLGGRFELSCANGLARARELVLERSFDLVITDIQLDRGESGLDLVDLVREKRPLVPVVVMTAYASTGAAVEAIRRGAADFLTKPFGSRELEAMLGRLARSPRAVRERLRPGGAGTGGGKRLIVGQSERMRSVYDLVAGVAPTRATILLTGESGTGKELVAGAVHSLSQRASGPFIKVNCAAITDTLLESTLFGHEKGAFTGAIKRTAGKFELANGGTLLLDEISEMKVELQSKLLRVLQEREFELLGGTSTIPVDVRIITTSNRDMRAEVRKGNFREDLFFRLNVVPIHLPPLRERPEDIPELVEHFLGTAATENDVARPQLAQGLMRELARLPWPGNVRQLQNAVERAVVLSRGRELTLDAFRMDEDMVHVRSDGLAFTEDMTIREMEKRMILDSLSRYSDNRTQAARQLGISVRTLRNKLNLYRQQARGTAA